MGKQQVNTGRGNQTVNTNNVWDRIVALENNGVPNLSAELNGVKSSLAEIAYNVKSYGAKGDGVTDDSAAIQATINAIKTSEYTEGMPTQGAKAKIIIPAGRYKISSKITVPSYINIEGSGRHSTILDSYITNGNPVFMVTHNESVKEQQFYNTIKGLTINGRDQVCQGIKLNSVSRWVLEDVVIDHTKNEGLYTYESYLGEVKSCLVRACGDATHFSVVYDGRDSNNGAHATTWIGGEVNGGGSSVNGVDIKYGNSVRFFGATIQGFVNGVGILNENGLATVVQGCYFEENKGHIETASAYAPNYTGNMFGAPTSGALGHLIIKNMYAGKIEGNFFSGTGITHVASKDATVQFRYSTVRGNYVQVFPLVVSPELITDGKDKGSIVESFNGEFYSEIQGYTQYKDVLKTVGEFRPWGGINEISGQPNVRLLSGVGSPEGVAVATKGIYIDINGAVGSSVYIKTSGTNNAANWKPLQELRWCTTATRPTIPASNAGYMAYDSTLNKPIWWNGAVWKDAMGTTV